MKRFYTTQAFPKFKYWVRPPDQPKEIRLQLTVSKELSDKINDLPNCTFQASNGYRIMSYGITVANIYKNSLRFNPEHQESEMSLIGPVEVKSKLIKALFELRRYHSEKGSLKYTVELYDRPPNVVKFKILWEIRDFIRELPNGEFEASNGIIIQYHGLNGGSGFDGDVLRIAHSYDEILINHTFYGVRRFQERFPEIKEAFKEVREAYIQHQKIDIIHPLTEEEF